MEIEEEDVDDAIQKLRLCARRLWPADVRPYGRFSDQECLHPSASKSHRYG